MTHAKVVFWINEYRQQGLPDHEIVDILLEDITDDDLAERIADFVYSY